MNSSFGAWIYNKSDFKNSSKENLTCYLTNCAVSRTFKIFSVLVFGGFGILGNIFIIVLALNYTVKKNLHHLIVNMAVADTLVVLITFVVEVPSLFDEGIWAVIKWESGNSICKGFGYCLSSFMLLSYLTLLLISLQRFKATRSTVQIRRYTVKQCLGEIACSWLISMALGIYEIAYRTIEYRGYGLYGCEIFQMPFSLDMTYYAVLITTYLCIIILSAVTLRRISHPCVIETSLTEKQRKKRTKQSKNCVKMVLSSLFLYSFSYLPFLIWNLIKGIADGTHNTKLYYCLDLYIFDFLIALFPLVNSCFSPWIFLVFLNDFRDAAKWVFCSRVSSHINNSRLRRNLVVPQQPLDQPHSGTSIISNSGNRQSCRVISTSMWVDQTS